MYCELKHDQYWVWSSRLTSLDCMPQYKINADSIEAALLDVYDIKRLSAQKKRYLSQLKKQREYYRDVTKPRQYQEYTNNLKQTNINNNYTQLGKINHGEM